MRTQIRPTVAPAKAADLRAAPSAADAHAWQEAAAAAGRMRLADAETGGLPAGPEGRAEPGGAREDAASTDENGAPVSRVAPRSLAEPTHGGAERPSVSGTDISAHAKASGSSDARPSATKEAAPRGAPVAETTGTEAAKTVPPDHDPAGHGNSAGAEADKKPEPRHPGSPSAPGGTAPDAKGGSEPAGAAAPVPAGAAAGGGSATPSPVSLAAASGALASVAQAGGEPAPAAGRDARTRLISVQAAAGLAALPLPPAPPSAAAAPAGAAPSGAEAATAPQAGQPGLQRAAADLAGMGGGSISVTLRPPTLGAVQVQMAIGATGAAHIQLTAATHEGYAVLAAAGPALVQHLAGAGIAVGSLRTAMQGGSGQGQQGQEQPRGNGAPAETRRADDEGEDRILGYA